MPAELFFFHFLQWLICPLQQFIWGTMKIKLNLSHFELSLAISIKDNSNIVDQL
jgi:hypothetical protein